VNYAASTNQSGNIFQNLNPMTKKYLQDIEKAYTKRAESLGGIPNNKGTVGY